MEKTELLQVYRELDADCARLAMYRLPGQEDRKGLFLPDEKNMEAVWKRWEELKQRVEELPEPDRVFSLVKHHFQDFLEEQEYAFRSTQEHPEWMYLGMHWALENAFRMDRRPDSERWGDRMNHFRQLEEAKDPVLGLIQKQQDEAGQVRLAEAFMGEMRTLEEFHQTLGTDFPTFSEEQLSQLDQAIYRYQELLKEMAGALSQGRQAEEAPADDLSRTVKMDVEAYRTVLKKQLGVSLDELLSWYQEEIEKTRREVFEIAGRLDIPEPAPKTMQEVTDLLFQYEPPCGSPKEMLERANSYLQRTRALAHEYVRLPEDETCICIEVPRSCRDSYPWGGYEGGDFRFRPLQGHMFLNTSNYKNVSDGWIKLNSLHEAYPGHHVQYVRAEVDPKPETVRMGAKRVPVLEGTCLRTERAFQGLFEKEDPFFPLFVAYRRHHASVRIQADLMLFYFGNTLEEVVQLYERELGFDRVTALGQVRAHQNTPGYFTCYYYGMKKLCGWEQEYGFSKKDYTELLFSAGYISIDRLGELVKLTPEERERYYTQFASLVPEKERQLAE